ncbi:hypothetical protein [Thermococcus sp.]|uniref:hypothetical protein n=1 Tax=Thermococcus sp. TaxID=35749 RepID=UPI002617C837|nr:hypothetical protein [Thermococcus sp.]
MESVASNFEEVFALANLLRTRYLPEKKGKGRKTLKGSWRELREYIEEYRDVSGQ